MQGLFVWQRMKKIRKKYEETLWAQDEVEEKKKEKMKTERGSYRPVSGGDRLKVRAAGRQRGEQIQVPKAAI